MGSYMCATMASETMDVAVESSTMVSMASHTRASKSTRSGNATRSASLWEPRRPPADGNKALRRRIVHRSVDWMRLGWIGLDANAWLIGMDRNGTRIAEV